MSVSSSVLHSAINAARRDLDVMYRDVSEKETELAELLHAESILYLEKVGVGRARWENAVQDIKVDDVRNKPTATEGSKPREHRANN